MMLLGRPPAPSDLPARDTAYVGGFGVKLLAQQLHDLTDAVARMTFYFRLRHTAPLAIARLAVREYASGTTADHDLIIECLVLLSDPARPPSAELDCARQLVAPIVTPAAPAEAEAERLLGAIIQLRAEVEDAVAALLNANGALPVAGDCAPPADTGDGGHHRDGGDEPVASAVAVEQNRRRRQRRDADGRIRYTGRDEAPR